MRQLIKQLWHGILGCWNIRCKLQHTADEMDPTTTSRLKAQIQAIYNHSHNLTAEDQLPFRIPIENILSLPTIQQRSWIANHQSYLNTKTKQAQQRSLMGVHDIRTYFQPKQPTPSQTQPNTSPDDKPPWFHPRCLFPRDSVCKYIVWEGTSKIMN